MPVVLRNSLSSCHFPRSSKINLSDRIAASYHPDNYTGSCGPARIGDIFPTHSFGVGLRNLSAPPRPALGYVVLLVPSYHFSDSGPQALLQTTAAFPSGPCCPDLIFGVVSHDFRLQYHRDQPWPTCDEIYRVRIFQAPQWACMWPMQQAIYQDSSMILLCSLEICKHQC